MEFSCVLFLIILPGIFGAHHHPHHVTIADCFGHVCGDVESRCLIREERGHLRPHCAEPHLCRHVCTGTVQVGHDGCCCNDQACVDAFKATQTSILSSTVRCKDCHNILTNDCVHTTICHGEESCLLHFLGHRIESYCAPKHECEGKHDHVNQNTICCHDDACVAAATTHTVQPDKTTTQPTVQVSHTCVDADNTGYCHAFSHQICTSFDYITHQHAVKYCAHTCNFCIEYLAMMSQNTVTKSTSQPLQTTEERTTEPTTTHLCKDHDTSGYCADYKDTICSSVDFKVHQQAVMKCANTCNFCFEYLAYMSHTTRPTTLKVTTTTPPLLTTKPMTEPAPTSTGTSAPQVTSLCEDTDISGYCQTNAKTLCTSFDFNVHQEAVMKCANTCNFCIEYIALHSQTSTIKQAASVESTSMAPIVNNNPSSVATKSLPTTTHLCQDQDTTGFCQANSSQICTSFDMNVHKEAVMKCADTCNFCVEYLILYGATTTMKPVTTTTPTTAATTGSPSSGTLPATTNLCIDKDTTGYCATNAQTICTSFDFNIHQEAVMKCASTCNFCVEYLLLKDQTTTLKPVTSKTTTTAATTESPSTSTLPATTNLCIDKDTTGYCATNAQKICTSFDFNIHQEAVMKCANTCNFCVEYLILNSQSP